MSKAEKGLEPVALHALLVECRKWQAEGEDGAPLGRHYWTPAYTDFMDRLDAAIAHPPALSVPRSMSYAGEPRVDAPARIGPDTPDNDMVICPQCTSQFRAIPVSVQQLMLGAGFKPPFTDPPTSEPDTGADSLSQGGGAHASATDNSAVRAGGFRDPVSPTSEWNDAIEAAVQEINNMTTFADADVYDICAEAIRALKREPR